MAGEFKIKNGFVIGENSTYNNPINKIKVSTDSWADEAEIQDQTLVSQESIKNFVNESIDGSSIVVNNITELQAAIAAGHHVFINGQAISTSYSGSITLPGSTSQTADFDWIFIGEWQFGDFTINNEPSTGYPRAVIFDGDVIQSGALQPLNIESRDLPSYIKSFKGNTLNYFGTGAPLYIDTIVNGTVTKDSGLIVAANTAVNTTGVVFGQYPSTAGRIQNVQDLEDGSFIGGITKTDFDLLSSGANSGLLVGTEGTNTGYWLKNDDRTLKGDIGQNAVDLSSGQNNYVSGAFADYSHTEGGITTTGALYSQDIRSSVAGSFVFGFIGVDFTSRFSSSQDLKVIRQDNNETYTIPHADFIDISFGNFTYDGNNLLGYNKIIYTGHAILTNNIKAVIGNALYLDARYSHAEGYTTIADGYISHAEGEVTIAFGRDSHAEGGWTKALGDYSHAEGDGSYAIGNESHAEGRSTRAIGTRSHAEGSGTLAIGEQSHAEGMGTIARGDMSHAEGFSDQSFGVNSHTEGIATSTGRVFKMTGGTPVGEIRIDRVDVSSLFTLANDLVFYSIDRVTEYTIPKADLDDIVYISTGTGYTKITHHHAGFVVSNYSAVISNIVNSIDGTMAASMGAHAEGSSSQAIGSASHAEGGGTISLGSQSHAEGWFTIASGADAHAEGNGSKATGDHSHAEGWFTIASGFISHAEGQSTTASGMYSHAEGMNTTASGDQSHAEGRVTIASGSDSHSEGTNTTASGDYSHAEGSGSQATGNVSHAEGTSIASGNTSHAEGGNTTASGDLSHAEGSNTIADGLFSHAEGNVTKTQGAASHSEGDNTKTLDVFYSQTDIAGSVTILDDVTFYFVKTSNLTVYRTDTNAEYTIPSGDIISVTFEDLGGTTILYNNSNHAGLAGNIEYLKPNNYLYTGHASHAEGYNTTAFGRASHAEGWYTRAVGEYSHAEGAVTFANGKYSHSEGSGTRALGMGSHSEGIASRAFGDASHAEGGSAAYGHNSHAEGGSCNSYGLFSHAEGMASNAYGDISHAEGESAAYGKDSHAEGFVSKAFGSASHAEGDGTKAIGYSSHAEGQGTKTGYMFSVDSSTADILKISGDQTQYFTKDNGLSVIDDAGVTVFILDADVLDVQYDGVNDITEITYSNHPELIDNADLVIWNSGGAWYSHAEGNYTTASGYSSHAEGQSTTASGNNSHAEGQSTTASGNNSHAEGDTTISGGPASHTEGKNTNTSDGSLTIFNQNVDSSVLYKIKFSSSSINDYLDITNYFNSSLPITINLISGGTTELQPADYGYNINFEAPFAIINYVGFESLENDVLSVVSNLHKGSNAHAEGYNTTASGQHAHAEGYNTTASGFASHAGGTSSIASGYASNAMGESSIAKGRFSFSEGQANKSISGADISMGIFNISSNQLLPVDRTIAGVNPWDVIVYIKGDYTSYFNYITRQTIDYVFTQDDINSTLPYCDSFDSPLTQDITYDPIEDETVIYTLTPPPGQSIVGVVPHILIFNAMTDIFPSAATAIGTENIAGAPYAMATGHRTKAYGKASFASGFGTTASGIYSQAEGIGSIASGVASHAEGTSTIASAFQSHAEGQFTIASGSQSHAEGNQTTASGGQSHAEGQSTTASGSHSHAEGYGTVASEADAHAEGHLTTANGIYSHAEGESTIASGFRSHSEGGWTTASGSESHAEGDTTNASGSVSHAEGYHTTASGTNSHSEGFQTTASGGRSHAEGFNTISSSHASHAEGSYTITAGEASHSEGFYSTSLGDHSHAEGVTTTAIGYGSHTEGLETKTGYSFTVIDSSISGQLLIDGDQTSYFIDNQNLKVFLTNEKRLQTITDADLLTITYSAPNTVITYDNNTELLNNTSFVIANVNYDMGYYSHAEGYQTNAIGSGAHAEGWQTIASGAQSHAEGFIAIASGSQSHAEGSHTTASGNRSHAEGDNTTASGNYSHASGTNTTASGSASTSLGSGTNAKGDYSFTQGQYSNSLLSNDISMGMFANASNQLLHVDRIEVVSGPEIIAYIIGDYTSNIDYATKPTIDCIYISDDINTLFTYSGSLSMPLRQACTYDVDNDETLVYTLATPPGTTIVGVIPHTIVFNPMTDTFPSTAIALGMETIAGNAYATAIGHRTKAYGKTSFASGFGTTASGEASHAEGSRTTASGQYSHAEGQITTASNHTAHAEGYQTSATAHAAHSEGDTTTASGDASHAEGSQTTASGPYTHAEGFQTTAEASFTHAEGHGTLAQVHASHAEGYLTIAGNHASHAEGESTTASGAASHAEGTFTTASGPYSHSEGAQTTARGLNSHVEGLNSVAVGSTSHAEGISTITISEGSHAEGVNTKAIGLISHSEGYNSKTGYSFNVTDSSTTGQLVISGDQTSYFNDANPLSVFLTTEKTIQVISDTDFVSVVYSAPNTIITYDNNVLLENNASFVIANVDLTMGQYSHAEGNQTIASGTMAHSEGYLTTASGAISHAEGNSSLASGAFAHAEGQSTQSTGTASHAEGQSSHATGDASHAEGNATIASGTNSHAEGAQTTASGSHSHAEGQATIASGLESHAEGASTIASGAYSHAEGDHTTAGALRSHAEGSYNTILVSAPDGAHVEGKFANDVGADKISVIGIGVDVDNRKDGRIMWTDGTMTLPEATNALITSRGNQAVTTKKYVDDQIGLAITTGMDYKGGYDAATDTPSLDDGTPIAGIKIGDVYTVTVGGTFFTETVEVGDTLIARQDDPTTLAHWVVVQANMTPNSILTALKTVDGTGSGLDADLLDGQEGSYYLNTTYIIDEDNMVSNSDTKVPTQQSVKAYVDSKVLPVVTFTTSTTTANQIADTNSATTYRTVKYVAQITSGSSYQSCELLICHDGSTAKVTEYANIYTGSALSTFDADVSGGNIRLKVTPVNAVTTYKIIKTMIEV